MGIKGKISFAAFTLGICGVLTAIIFCAVERVELSRLKFDRIPVTVEYDKMEAGQRYMVQQKHQHKQRP